MGGRVGVHLKINLVYKILAVEHFKQTIHCSWFTKFLNKCTGFFVLEHVPKSVFYNQIFSLVCLPLVYMNNLVVLKQFGKDSWGWI